MQLIDIYKNSTKKGNVENFQELDGVGVFCAGRCGRFTLKKLKEIGIPVKAVYDNNVNLQGTIIEGVPCVSPRELEGENIFVIIAVATSEREGWNIHDIYAQLDMYNVRYTTAWEFFPYLSLKSEFGGGGVRHVYDMLYDERSRKTLETLLIAGVEHDENKIDMKDIYEPNQYFCFPHMIENSNNFVDCGAYVGDTVEQCLWNTVGVIDKIYAFEPGDRQFTALQARSERLSIEWALKPNAIECIQAGVGAKSAFGKIFNENMALSGFSVRETEDGSDGDFPIVALDEYLKDIPVSFIKADIEGFEMDMLRGAEKLIKTHKPNLAVCVYHNPADYYEIPLYIKSLAPEYHMALRHHSHGFHETVLYCWV